MRFSTPLTAGVLVRRYKRFLADVELPGAGIVTAHTPNSGSLLGLTDPGNRVWLSPIENPKAKLRWRLEIIEAAVPPRGKKVKVGVNTGLPNRLVREAIEAGDLPALGGYDTIRAEVKYGANSRVDLLLESKTARPCWVEVKNVTLAEGDVALFPDAVTARGLKHLRELTARVQVGDRAAMVYVVQRGDCERMAPARAIDPAYAAGLAAAAARGVELYCIRMKVGLRAIDFDKELPLSV